ncbi:hypothetical protein GCM10007301_06530 [Azorhizobium oxalatiphilum]|uniref:Cyanovirin-N domain-containing protein n=1 Tax=Azorhizobium oxalatiphilum TaxID=980631 RepID=A0A917BM40_9HYPH|nr:CVNH domain-containing protein [Azorhizobium oxalatiphilum]GGF49973.1 hypothetical protein GCM10007301_06530 [Azorhizobium oxalatiphilum]
MRVKFILGLAAGVALSAAALLSGAAEAKPQVPDGSYLRTCRNANIFQGRDLLAMCPNNQGMLAVVKLPNYQLCGGDIANINGQLMCTGGRGRGGPPPGGPGWGGGGGGWNQGGYNPPPPPPPPGGGYGRFPPGSYLQSCQNVRVNRGWLQASCADVRGNWRETQAPLDQCRAFGNNNGRLVCG